MAKRGRPRLSDAEKARKLENKLYAKYQESYKRYKRKYNYNLKPMMDKADYLEAYKAYKYTGSSRPMVSILKDQVVYTEKQSKAWAKNLKANLKKWKALPEEDLLPMQKKLLNKVKEGTLKSDYFYLQDQEAKEIIDIINRSSGWDVAVGS